MKLFLTKTILQSTLGAYLTYGKKSTSLPWRFSYQMKIKHQVMLFPFWTKKLGLI